MTLNNPTYFKFLFPLCFCLCTFSANASTIEQTPLDSIKQVLRDLNIPYDLQENWIEPLEDLEDEQDTPVFRALLVKVDKKIKDYLVDPSSYEPKPRKKKKKLKDKLNRIGKGIADKVDQTINSAEVIGLLEAGRSAERNRNYAKAILHYREASDLLAEQEKWEKWVDTQIKIADIKAIHQKDYAGALEILPDVKDKMRELGDGAGMKMVDTKMRNLQKNLDLVVVKEAPTPILPTPATPEPPVVTTSTPTTPAVTPALPDMTAQIEQQKEELAKQQAAIEEQKRQDRLRAEEMARAKRNNDQRKLEALRKEERKSKAKRLEAEKEAKDIQDKLEIQEALLAAKINELEKKDAEQKLLFGGLGVLGFLFLSAFFMYRSKKKDHGKLAVAYEELEVAQAELKEAEQKIKGLLDQQVSGAVAAELLAGNATTKKHERRFVCIMFLDIRNFTPFVESKTPEEIIDYQNKVLGFMMEKVIEHKGIVNTVLGDGFMATFGAPVSAGNDCLQAYKAAVEIMQMVRAKSQSGEIPPTKIGIGMHAGNVVAGNVGTKTRKQYLITGNTVIVASRLEQLNKQYGSSLIISREVVERLPSAMNLPKVFDQVMVKGRSKPVQIAKYG